MASLTVVSLAVVVTALIANRLHHNRRARMRRMNRDLAAWVKAQHLKQEDW